MKLITLQFAQIQRTKINYDNYFCCRRFSNVGLNENYCVVIVNLTKSTNI